MRLNRPFPRTCNFAGVIVAFSATVFGEPGAARERVRIDYDVPAQCPAQAFYEGRVQTRLRGQWVASKDELARLLRVSAISHGTMWYASLDFTDETGRSVTRTVKGATCEQAVAAIALVTALAIESPGSEAFGADTESTEFTVNEATVTTEATPGRTSNVPGRVTPQDSKLKKSDEVSVERPFTYEACASYLRTQGVGPGYANGVDLLFGLSLAPATSMVRAGFSLFDSGTDTTELPRVRARVRTFATRLQSCPLRLDFGKRFALPICAGVELGLLHVRGSGNAPELVKGQSDQVFWFVPSLSPRLRVDAGSVFVEVGPELRLFLTQRQFSVRYGDKLTQAFETPWGALGLVTTAGLHF